MSQSAVLLVTPGLLPSGPKASCVLDAAPVGMGAKAEAVANAERAKMVENFMVMMVVDIQYDFNGREWKFDFRLVSSP